MKNRTFIVFFLSLITVVSSLPSLYAQSHPLAKLPSSTAIEVEMIKSAEVSVPAEFQIALYENLIQELEKKGEFRQVYREGDRNIAGDADIIVVHAKVTSFKKGSEMARQVTTVSGETSIVVQCQFTDPKGRVLLERGIEGKVRFLGDNLKATSDFAKKASNISHDALSLHQAKSQSDKTTSEVVPG